MAATPTPASQSGSSRAAEGIDAASAAPPSAHAARAMRSATGEAQLGILADVECAAPPGGEGAPQVGERERVVHEAEGVHAGLEARLAEDVPGEDRDQRLLHVHLVR